MPKNTDLDKIRNLYNEAEEEIKKIEQLEDTLYIPAVNELRYAGRHIVDYSVNKKSDILSKAERHCYRAIYDCHDVRCSWYLENIVKFFDDYNKIPLSPIIPDIIDIKKEIFSYRDQISLFDKDSKEKDNREDFYIQLKAITPRLKDIFEKLDLSREEANKVIRQNAQSQLIIKISLIVSVASLVTAVLTIVL